MHFELQNCAFQNAKLCISKFQNSKYAFHNGKICISWKNIHFELQKMHFKCKNIHFIIPKKKHTFHNSKICILNCKKIHFKNTI